MTTDQEVKLLKRELTGLFEYMKRVRLEIAAIHHPAEEDYHFDTMADQLDAIVKATEKATNTIMEVIEHTEDAVGEIRSRTEDAEILARCDQITDNGMAALEACSFQDITGQRINKVTKSLTYVEKRVDTLIEVWGKEELAKVAVDGEEKTEDEKLLHGPQLEGQGISQAEIDKLFD